MRKVEIFKLITLPDIKPRYWVSNMGRVYNSKSEKYLKGSYDKDGYVRVNLTKTNGKKQTLRVHRLVAMCFIFDQRPDQIQVNHLDGDVENNERTNLEWCTDEENRNHAIRNGLRWYPKGEKVKHSLFTNDQVHQICGMLENGKSYKHISKKLELEFSEGLVKVLCNIKRGITWKHISKDYNISQKAMNQTFTKDTIHKFCQLIEQGYGNTDIANMTMNVLDISKPKIIGTLNQIRFRRCHKNISKNYTW